METKWSYAIIGILLVIVVVLAVVLITAKKSSEFYKAPKGVGKGCSYKGKSGTCQDMNHTNCSGQYKSGLCPGPSNVRCCLPNGSNSGSSSEYIGQKCGNEGTCLDVNTSTCSNGSFATGLCPGPANIKCCQKSSSVSVSCTPQQYPPNSQKAIDLLTAAAVEIGRPASWGSSPDTHEVMRRESAGWVGIPNYTYGSRTKDRSQWCSVWEELKRGVHPTRSSATGLGQLLSSNAAKYYPNGVNGIGDPRNEAIGFLKYIYDRYGSPEVARSMHGSTGSYVNARTGKTQNKTFKEGY